MMQYSVPLSDDEFEKLIDQKPFARGTRRTVHNVPTDPSVVVKRMTRLFGFANHLEWIIWNAVKDSDLRDVFGCCITISESARYLMMERLDDLSATDRTNPPKVPVWIEDVKGWTSFGKNVAGEMKLRDYDVVRLTDTLAAAERR